MMYLFRTTATSGQTEDSIAKRYVWNYYNRIARAITRIDTTVNWIYSTATFRQANGSTANQLDFVIGVSEDLVVAMVASRAVNSTATARNIETGIGLDGTTNNSTLWQNQATTSSLAANATAMYSATIAVGRHFLTWLEKGSGADSQTWAGTAGGVCQSGIYGTVWG